MEKERIIFLIMIKKKQEALEKKIKKLTNELNKLKEPEFYYNVGDVVMLNENKLLVTVLKKFIKGGRKMYEVSYTHHKNCENYGFTVFEEDLQEKPYDYNAFIFNEYIELLTKYKNLVNALRRGEIEE